MKLFSGNANRPLAEKLVQEFNTTVSPIELHVFPDGEQRVMLEEDVVDQDIVIVQPTNTPVDSNIMQLVFLIDAAKRNGARFVTAVIPYLGYSRQDHIFRTGESRSLEIVARMIENAGADRVISCDVHSIKIPEIFQTLFTNLSALPLFAKKIKSNNWVDKDTALVSPDMGGVRRIKQIAEMLGNMPIVTIQKDRDLKSGDIKASNIDGEVKRRAIVVDDMISSGKTIVQAADILKEKEAEEIYVFATHAIFSTDAPKLLQESEISKVYVTDSVFIPSEKQFAKLEILSIAGMIAQAIKQESQMSNLHLKSTN